MPTQKNAIVTGSTSGIGRGIALKLASDGVRVMINGFGDVTILYLRIIQNEFP